MNYDNYYKNGGMTKEESVSAIALRIGARKDAVAKFVEEHKIDTNKLNSDLKSGKVYFMDVITAIVGKTNNKYQKEIIKKYGSKMAMGGKTQGYDDREDERLGMDYGKISGKDFDGSHDMREHSRRDDARFEKRMARGGKLESDFIVGDSYFNSSEGGKYKFVGKDDSGRLIFTDAKGTKRIFSPKKMYKYADGGVMADGGEVYYVRDFYPNYDEDKIVSILKSNGFKKVRKAKLYGWSNQPDVAVFEGDKNQAQEILEKEFPDNYISIYVKDWGRKMADGGETERDKNGMLYALQEHVSSGEIASKTNASKYEDIDKIRSKAIQYYMENGDKPYSYAELESVLKKFDHTKYADGGHRFGEVEEYNLVRKGMFEYIKNYYLNEYPTDELGADINPRADFDGLLMVLNEGDDVYEYLGVSDSLVRERVFQKLADIMGVDYNQIYDMWLSSDDKFKEGGAIENQYEGRTPQDIWDSLDSDQRYHFIDDHALQIEMLQDENYDFKSNKFPKSINIDLITKSMQSDWKDLDSTIQNRFKKHVRMGEYAKGGKVSYREAGENYEYVNTFGIEQDDFEQIVDAYHKSPSPNQMDRIESRTTFNKMRNKYGLEKVDEVGNYIHKTHQSHGKMAQGGALPKQNQLNKKVLDLIQKANIDSKLEFGQLVVSALTDANAHSEVRKFISIMENKPEWAEKPKEIDMKLPREEFEKQRAKTVYSSKYYDANEKINDLGVKIANMFGWDIVDISDALIFASKMSGRNDVAQALEKLDSDDEKQDETKNKWNYTDVDDIEYVVVKDKSGKELKFNGKDVISGVHDLLEKGGKLTEIGKYYSKNDVVSVVVNGKNILDKNTVSGVWIKKDAKPMAEDVADMKIGKTTIKKGVNGWVAKTMVDNFKGYDWDISTIKNYKGDLVTTAQGGKSEDKGGYKMFTFLLFQDPSIRLKSSRPARVTDKVVTAQHEEALKDWKERQDEIAEMVDQIQSKKKMADGGAIGFDALAKKVAKNYEGDKVKKQYQDEYGKTYDKKEAEEVGKKVAGKVYAQQQAQKKMAKGGKVAKKSGTSANRSQSKMTLIARKASEIRKANEPWRDAFNRAKAMLYS